MELMQRMEGIEDGVDVEYGEDKEWSLYGGWKE